jgi:hypothetical protein
MNFLIHEENFLFFFISIAKGIVLSTQDGKIEPAVWKFPFSKINFVFILLLKIPYSTLLAYNSV